MLMHHTLGPTAAGQFLVAYTTPGCAIPTVTCVCTARGQADDEARRLNALQIQREKSLRIERDLCGLDGTYPEYAQ